MGWPFQDPPGTATVTTKHVTQHRRPILYASHEVDEDGEATWQFHHDVEQFKMEDAQLVRLDTIIKIDPSVAELANLPVGHSAARNSREEPWVFHS
jgi:hypothetical protein